MHIVLWPRRKPRPTLRDVSESIILQPGNVYCNLYVLPRQRIGTSEELWNRDCGATGRNSCSFGLRICFWWLARRHVE